MSQGGRGCSRRLGVEPGLPRPILIPMLCCGRGSRRAAAVQAKARRPPAEHGFSAFILWLELLLQGFRVPS